MKPGHRKILFFLFVTLFFVSAPLLVLYTAGYRYNVFNGQFVRTGVLSVSTTPRSANISLDGKQIKQTSPYVIKQLVPGTYDVTLSREGYHDWNGEVEVTSGTTTLLQHILLFRNEPPELLPSEIDHSLAPSPNGKQLIYVTQEGGWAEVWSFEVATGTETMIGRFVSNPSDPFEASWSSGGEHILLTNAAEGLLTVYAKNGNQIELDSELTRGWNQTFWHPSNGSLLYIATAKELRQIDVQDGSLTIFDDPNAETVVLDASILTFNDNGTQVELRQTLGEDSSLIALLPRATYEIVHRDGPYLILSNNRGRLYVLNITSDQPLLLEADAELFDWHSGSRQLVYTDGYEVNIYSPDSHTTEFVTRQGEEITSLIWHESNRAILLGTQTKITAIERYQIGTDRQSTVLLEGNFEELWISDDGRFAYIFGRIGEESGLFELRLTR